MLVCALDKAHIDFSICVHVVWNCMVTVNLMPYKCYSNACKNKQDSNIVTISPNQTV